jgi:hypothetical protein
MSGMEENIVNRLQSRGWASWILTVTALALSAIPSTAHAVSGPIGYTLYGGLYSGPFDDPFVGAGIRVGLGGFAVTPNAEYVFHDGITVYSFNADGTIPIIPLGVASIYGGGGIGWLHTDPDVGESNTETVINVLAGANLSALPMKPYGQIKHVFTDGDDPWVFAVGIRF